MCCIMRFLCEEVIVQTLKQRVLDHGMGSPTSKHTSTGPNTSSW